MNQLGLFISCVLFFRMSQEIQVLVLGAENTGKTLLLKRLQKVIAEGINVNSFDSIPSTVATVGTNIVNVTWNKRKYNFRELGGAMAPIWKNYYSDCQGVIFLIDVGNPFQVSASTVLFYDMLSESKLAKVPVILLFNKIDQETGLKISELKFILRLKDLQKHLTQNLTIAECSLKDGQGTQDVLNWLQKKCIPGGSG